MFMIIEIYIYKFGVCNLYFMSCLCDICTHTHTHTHIYIHTNIYKSVICILCLVCVKCTSILCMEPYSLALVQMDLWNCAYVGVVTICGTVHMLVL